MHRKRSYGALAINASDDPLKIVDISTGEDAPVPALREIPALIQQLRELREQLRVTRADRDALSDEVGLLRRQNQHLQSRGSDARALVDEVRSLQQENDALRARLQEASAAPQERVAMRETLQLTAQSMKESHFREAAANRRIQEMRFEQAEELRRHEETRHDIKALKREAQEMKLHLEAIQPQLRSLREARDNAAAQCRLLSDKLEQSEHHIANLEHTIEHLEDAARITASLKTAGEILAAPDQNSIPGLLFEEEAS